jgi:hypothetical protein
MEPTARARPPQARPATVERARGSSATVGIRRKKNMIKNEPCPLCDGEMIWQEIAVNAMRFLLYDGKSQKYAWKCSKCGVELGGTYKEYMGILSPPPPPKKLILPYECEARKHFRFLFHTGKLLITSEELSFADPKDSKYSYALSAIQLKQAKIEPAEFLTGDICITFSDGTKYDIGLDQDQQDMVMAAIGLMLK